MEDSIQPVRSELLGYEWPGSYFVGEEELELVTRVVRARSPFRWYGLDLQNMCAPARTRRGGAT